MATKSKYLETLAASVATGTQIKDAAAVAGCSVSHAYHLSATDEFKTLVSELRTAAINAAVSGLTAAASQAVAVLVALMAETQDPPVRLNAAKAILANVIPISELAELRSRLDALSKPS